MDDLGVPLFQETSTYDKLGFLACCPCKLSLCLRTLWCLQLMGGLVSTTMYNVHRANGNFTAGIVRVFLHNEEGAGKGALERKQQGDAKVYNTGNMSTCYTFPKWSFALICYPQLAVPTVDSAQPNSLCQYWRMLATLCSMRLLTVKQGLQVLEGCNDYDKLAQHYILAATVCPLKCCLCPALQESWGSTQTDSVHGTSHGSLLRTKETWLGKLESTLQSEKLSAQLAKFYTELPKDAKPSEARGAEEKSKEVLEKSLEKKRRRALMEMIPSYSIKLSTFITTSNPAVPQTGGTILSLSAGKAVLSTQEPSVSADVVAIRSEIISRDLALLGFSLHWLWAPMVSILKQSKTTHCDRSYTNMLCLKRLTLTLNSWVLQTLRGPYCNRENTNDL